MASKCQALSFAERFEGRKAAISKEGLLHMFNKHPQAEESSSRSISQERQVKKETVISKNLPTKQHFQSSAR